MTHRQLCYLTAKHFVKKASLAVFEVSLSIREKPDALVMNSSGTTTLFEIKMSYSDFKADFKNQEETRHALEMRGIMYAPKVLFQKMKFLTIGGFITIKGVDFIL